MEQQVRWLLAWMNEDEAISSLLGRAPKAEEDISAQRRTWHDSRQALTRRGPFSKQSDTPLSETPSELKESLAAFQQRPDVIAALHGLDWSVGIVDLRKVLSFQKVVAEEDALKRAEVVVPGDSASLLAFCLPERGGEVMIAGTIDQDQRGITFSSQNPNLRIGGPLIIDLDVSPAPGQPTRKEKFLGFAVNFGVRFMQVAEYNGRWFLRDGYHRAYGLLRRSIHKIPCVCVRAHNFAEVGAAAPGFFPYEVLFGDRPPFVLDFLDDSVSKLTSRLAHRKVVRVSGAEFQVEL